MQLQKKKNLILKLHECKLSLLGGNGCYILQSERRGNQVNITLSDITKTVLFWLWEVEGEKTFALSNEQRKHREDDDVQPEVAALLDLLH